MCIYRPLGKNKQYFLGNLSVIVNHYSSIYDKHMTLGDSNMEPNSPILISFILSLNIFNSIQSNTFQREWYLYRCNSYKEKILL